MKSALFYSSNLLCYLEDTNLLPFKDKHLIICDYKAYEKIKYYNHVYLIVDFNEKDVKPKYNAFFINGYEIAWSLAEEAYYFYKKNPTLIVGGAKLLNYFSPRVDYVYHKKNYNTNRGKEVFFNILERGKTISSLSENDQYVVNYIKM